MRQIVYFSTAARRQDAIVIAGILASSRDRNRLDRVTGVLIAGGHRYLQVIEGPDETVGATYGRIRNDERHLSLTLLVDRPIDERSFRGWSMAYLQEPRLDEFATFQQLVDQMRFQVSDAKLRAQIDCFARTFAVAPAEPLKVQADTPWRLSVDRAH